MKRLLTQTPFIEIARAVTILMEINCVINHGIHEADSNYDVLITVLDCNYYFVIKIVTKPFRSTPMSAADIYFAGAIILITKQSEIDILKYLKP